MLKKKIWTNLQGFDLHIAGGILKALLAANFLLVLMHLPVEPLIKLGNIAGKNDFIIGQNDYKLLLYVRLSQSKCIVIGEIVCLGVFLWENRGEYREFKAKEGVRTELTDHL